MRKAAESKEGSEKGQKGRRKGRHVERAAEVVVFNVDAEAAYASLVPNNRSVMAFLHAASSARCQEFNFKCPRAAIQLFIKEVLSNSAAALHGYIEHLASQSR